MNCVMVIPSNPKISPPKNKPARRPIIRIGSANQEKFAEKEMKAHQRTPVKKVKWNPLHLTFCGRFSLKEYDLISIYIRIKYNPKRGARKKMSGSNIFLGKRNLLSRKTVPNRKKPQMAILNIISSPYLKRLLLCNFAKSLNHHLVTCSIC